MWANQRYYPLKRDVQTWSNKKILEKYKSHSQGIAFRGFTEANQYGVFMRALREEIKKRKLRIK